MPRNIEQIVEAQVARWRAEHKRTDQRAHAFATRSDREATRPRAIAISYAPYANGVAIADHIAEALGLPHFDHEIVEHIASTAHVHVETVESLDTHVQNRIDDYILALFNERNFDRSDYLRLLGRSVVALWEHGPCVLSGHAAVHFVPREHVLRVRLSAPAEARARRLAAERGLEEGAARRALRRADAEQEAFHRKYFDSDVHDIEQFDLALDVEHLGEEAVVALVSQAFRARFGEPDGRGSA